MKTFWLILMVGCGLGALLFNTANALHLWGILGAFLAVFFFPVMFFVVPIALLIQGEMPVYWLLVPGMTLFGFLALRNE